MKRPERDGLRPMIRVAIVGAGYGGYVLAPAFQCCPGVTIAGLVAPTAARRDAVAAKLGIEKVAASLSDLLQSNEIDAVAIAVPPDRQVEIASMALERGLDVFAEKPLGVSLSQAEALAELAEKFGRYTAVGFLFPELPSWRRARELLLSGTIGTVRHVVVTWLFESFDHRHGVAGWKTDASRGGGVLQHFGSHTLYYLNWLLGEITDVTGQIMPAPGATSDSLASLQIRFASGATGAMVLSNAAIQGGGHRVQIFGETGVVALTNGSGNPVDFQLTIHDREGAKAATEIFDDMPIVPSGSDPRVAPVARLAARFIAAIQGGPPARPSFQDAVSVQRWMQPLLLTQ